MLCHFLTYSKSDNQFSNINSTTIGLWLINIYNIYNNMHIIDLFVSLILDAFPYRVMLYTYVRSIMWLTQLQNCSLHIAHDLLDGLGSRILRQASRVIKSQLQGATSLLQFLICHRNEASYWHPRIITHSTAIIFANTPVDQHLV